MESIKLLEDNVLEITNGEILKKKKNYIVPVFVTLLGAWLMIFNNSSLMLVNDNDITSILFFLGLFVFVAGVCLFFFQKEKFVRKSDNKEVRKYKIYFNVSEFDKLRRLYSEEKFDEIKNLKKGMDSGCLVTFIGAADGEFYYSQLLKYEPYSFIPYSETTLHTGDAAGKIKDLIAELA